MKSREVDHLCRQTRGRVLHTVLLYEGDEALPDMLVKTGEHAFNINRTAQVTEETSSVLDIRFDVAESVGTVRIRSALAE
jgi:hypothetical protein